MLAKLFLIVIILSLFIHYPKSSIAAVITMLVIAFPIGAAIVFIVLLYLAYLGRKSTI